MKLILFWFKFYWNVLARVINMQALVQIMLTLSAAAMDQFTDVYIDGLVQDRHNSIASTV